jgi:hypothetical protein
MTGNSLDKRKKGKKRKIGPATDYFFQAGIENIN